jgi:ubiquinone/menaquinone biosynthesis C-methylase UbiE
MDSKVFENHNKYLERIKIFKQYGYDVQAERRFILDAAQPLAGSILEVGTGKGHMTIALARAGYLFTSIDKSAEAQEFARMNIEYLGLKDQVNFELEDAEKMSFTDGSFDKIISVNTVHELEHPFCVLDEMVRVIAVRGRIILSDFTPAGFEIVEKIHANENKNHSRGKASLKQATEYLVEKNFAIKKVSSPFQDVVIAYNLN